MNQPAPRLTLAQVVRDAVALACVTALGIAHVIPGSTCVALLAPYLLVRAYATVRGPRDPGDGDGAGDVAGEDAPPSRPRRPAGFRFRVRQLVLVGAMRMVDPLAGPELVVMLLALLDIGAGALVRAGARARLLFATR